MNFDFLGFKGLPYNSSKHDLKGSDYMGVPTLTSLAFQYKNIRVQFEECIVTVNQEKNIVTTPIQGRDGTVKEYISDGDYTISVDAAVSNYNPNSENTDLDAILKSGDISAKGDDSWEKSSSYPLEKLEDLIRFLKIKDTLEVHSDFLTLFGVKNIVVKTYGMVQETHSNRQSFNIQMLSDTPFEIKIKQDAAINK